MSRRLGVVPALGQISQAGVNFLVIVGSARTLRSTDFVVVSVQWMVLALLMNGLRVTVSEQVIVARARGEVLSTSAIVSMAGVLAAAMFALGSCGILLAAGGDTEVGLLVTAVGCASLLYDAQRYVSLAEDEYRRLIAGDLTLMLGAMAAWLVATEKNNAVTLYAVVLVSLVGVTFLQGWGRQGPRWGVLRAFTQQLGSFISWSAAQVLLVNFAAQAVAYLSLPFIGAKDFAGLRAVHASLSPLTTPSSAMQPGLLKFLTLHSRRSQQMALMNWWIASSLLFSLALGLGLHVSATLWLPPLAGDRYLAYRSVVIPLVVAMGAVYAGLLSGMLMRVMRLGRASLVAQLIAIACGAGLVVVGSQFGGVQGAAWGLTAQSLVSVGVGALVVRGAAGRTTVQGE